MKNKSSTTHTLRIHKSSRTHLAYISLSPKNIWNRFVYQITFLISNPFCSHFKDILFLLLPQSFLPNNIENHAKNKNTVYTIEKHTLLRSRLLGLSRNAPSGWVALLDNPKDGCGKETGNHECFSTASLFIVCNHHVIVPALLYHRRPRRTVFLWQLVPGPLLFLCDPQEPWWTGTYLRHTSECFDYTSLWEVRKGGNKIVYIKRTRQYTADTSYWSRTKVLRMTMAKKKQTLTGADEYEHATLILSLCQGTFTDWSIFSIPFLLWKKGSSGLATQWHQLISCDWSWHSLGSLIPGKFDLKINRSMKIYSGVAYSYSWAPDCY